VQEAQDSINGIPHQHEKLGIWVSNQNRFGLILFTMHWTTIHSMAVSHCLRARPLQLSLGEATN
jgi:hypothetical protein